MSAMHHAAASQNSPDAISVLMEQGLGTEARDITQRTPLHHASQGRYAESLCKQKVILFVKNGASVNPKDKGGNTPLRYLVAGGCEGAAEILIKAGADVNDVNDNDKDQLSLLHLASRDQPAWDNLGLMALLLDAGADVNASDRKKRTPLHHALTGMYRKSYKMIPLLVDKGANVNARDIDGNTPLQYICTSNGRSQEMKEVVQTLVSAGADVKTFDNDRRGLFHVAVQKCHQEIMTLLLEAGADIHALDGNGRGPLHYAVQCGPTRGVSRKVELLVDKGANVDARDIEGKTPLHYLKRVWVRDEIEALVKVGADVNAIDDNQVSVLHVAAEGCDLSTVKLLLDAGADIHVRDGNQRTPLHYAVRGDYVWCRAEKIKHMADRGANVNARDINGNTPLNYLLDNTASQGFECQISVRTLISAGADVNTVNNDQTTPLHLAAQKGSKQVLALLLDAGANIHAYNSNQETPLDVAVSNQRLSADMKPLVDQCIEYEYSAGLAATVNLGAERLQLGEGSCAGNESADQCPGEEPGGKRRYSIAFPTKATN